MSSNARLAGEAAYETSADKPPGAESSDQELLALARDADAQAFGVLWERHRGAAEAFARVLVPADDAADVVSEAVLSTWSALCSGSGPSQEFRPYLFRAVRNAAIKSNQRRSRGPVPTENVELLEAAPPDSPTSVDDGVVVQAFQSLPPRWQAVLWYVDVDCESAHTVAKILGTSENSVYMTSRRAREGLRAAYLTAHAGAAATDACRWVAAKLGSYARGALSERQATKVRRHLETCTQCTDAWVSVNHLNTRLPMVLPLAIGGIAASWVQVALATGTTAAAVGGGSLFGGLWASAAGKTAVVATAAVAVTGVGLGVGNQLSHHPDVASQATPSITTPAPAPTSNPVLDPIASPTPALPSPAQAEPALDPATIEPTVTQMPTPSATPTPPRTRQAAPTQQAPQQPVAAPTVAPTKAAPAPTQAPMPTVPAGVTKLQVSATPDNANGVWTVAIGGVPAGSNLTVSDEASGRSVDQQVSGTQAQVRIGQLDFGTTTVTVEARQNGSLVAMGVVRVTPGS